MRKYLAVIGSALMVSLLAAPAAFGIDNDSTITGKITPKTLPKKNFKAATLFVETSTLDATDPSTDPFAPTIFPNQTTHTNIDFDDDIRFFTKGLARCQATPAELEGTNTAQAVAACGKPSKVGSGIAHVCVNNGTFGCTLAFGQTDGNVRAFNGKPTASGTPTIYLHAYVPAIAATQVLVGKIKNSPVGGDFGKRLDVPVNQQPLQASLTDFQATVEKDWKYKGKRRHYISARCHDGNKKFNYRGEFTYYAADPRGQAPADNPTDNQTCKVG